MENKILVGSLHNYSFELEEQIGRGGNGTVRKAVCHELDCVCAVKEINTYEPNNSERIERFKREIETIHELNEKFDEEFVIPIYDYAKDGESLWYAMPRAECLKNRLKNFIHPIEDKIFIIRKIGEIIAKIHEAGFAHRDIKPQNILLWNDKVFLSDFGLVWHSKFPRNTRTNEAIGPFSTIPPELLRGSAKFVKEPFYKSDVYEYAKTIWIILTENYFCFPESYQRERENVFLELKNIRVTNANSIKSLEPIHELLEQATLFDMHDRPNIAECMDFIDRWECCLQDDAIADDENAVCTRKNILAKIEPDKNMYVEPKKIIEGLTGLKEKFGLSILEEGTIENFNLKIKQCSLVDDFLISVVDFNDNIFLFAVCELVISKIVNEKITLKIKKFDITQHSDYKSIDIFIKEGMLGLPIQRQKIAYDRNETLELKRL